MRRLLFGVIAHRILFRRIFVCAKCLQNVKTWNVNEFCYITGAFLGERSEAYLHKDTSKSFCFYPVRDIPLRFISLNLIFSAPIGRIYPIFV